MYDQFQSVYEVMSMDVKNVIGTVVETRNATISGELTKALVLSRHK